eukprot:6313984-Amphidinium_carterae.1
MFLQQKVSSPCSPRQVRWGQQTPVTVQKGPLEIVLQLGPVLLDHEQSNAEVRQHVVPLSKVQAVFAGNWLPQRAKEKEQDGLLLDFLETTYSRWSS